MAISPITLLDTTARAKMNAAIAEANKVDGKAEASALSAEKQARILADTDERQARVAADAAERAALATGLAAEAQARAAAILALPLPVPTHHRPGDAPVNFGMSLPDGEVLPSPVPEALLRYDDAGRVVRLTGAGLLASRHLCALEPNRRFLVTFVVQRRVASPDPDNDAITCALAWYGQGKGRLTDTVVRDFVGLTIGAGRMIATAVVARHAGSQIDIVSPDAARYCRPYVQTYGNLVQSDVEIIRWLDVTDVVAFAPDVSALAARIAAIEAIDAGDRIGVLESEATAPSTIRLPTIGDLAAAIIPASVDGVELLGHTAAGDGGRALYRRAATEPSHVGKVQSLDGQWWELRESFVTDAMFGNVAGAKETYLKSFNAQKSDSIYRRSGITAPAIRTHREKDDDRVDLRDWDGLDFTGDNDCASVVVTAMAASAGEGFELKSPSGLIALGEPIDLMGDVRFTGQPCHRQFNGYGSDPVLGAGTWFRRGHDGVMFNGTTPGTGGSPILSHFGVFRDQPTPGSGTYTPLDDDFDFDFVTIEPTLTDIVTLNTSRFIRSEVGRLTMQDCGGQPLIQAVEVPLALDVLIIDKFRVFDYWSSNAKLKEFTLANRDDFKLGRIDNPFLNSIFSIHSRRMFHCYQYPGSEDESVAAGSISRASLVNYGFDGGGQLLYIAPGTVGTDFNFVNGYAFQDPGAESLDQISLNGSNAAIGVTNFRSTGAKRSIVKGVDAGNIVWLNSKLIFDGWNGDDVGAAALVAPASNRIYLDGTPALGPSNGAPISSGSGVKMVLYEGQTIGTTDGAGRILGIPHNARQAPAAILIREAYGEGGVTTAVINITAETFDLYFYEPDGSPLVVTGVSARWEAIAS